ncbi:hypothetical protein TRFO_05954 [Tritrichomonas foetus]|uniref:Bromo domain-containing protein n=1 Tax=Tritrichomonas foetus TaxID=1144522 RepID=A0A1J4K2E7_9EUKA|nr:hypothetical protein TRFO_05954 [Tritrichomonas foetus]|eukprot:OHT05371.1 hypothetical protein TRFO_05954 [Tritrichomonas foetus]
MNRNISILIWSFESNIFNMNLEFQTSCKEIMKQIIRRPISTRFWEEYPTAKSSQIPIPYPLKTISQKLDDNLYPTIEEWANDVRDLFQFHISRDLSPLDVHCATELLLEFDELFSKYISNISANLDKMRFSLDNVEDFWMKKNMWKFNTRHDKAAEKLPVGAAIFNMPNKCTKDPCKIIQRTLQMFESPEVFMMLGAKLDELHSDAIIENTKATWLCYSLIPDEDKEKLAEFSLELLKAMAQGIYDPYPNVYRLGLLEDYMTDEVK